MCSQRNWTNRFPEGHLDLASEGMEVIGRCSAVDHLRGGGGGGREGGREGKEGGREEERGRRDGGGERKEGGREGGKEYNNEDNYTEGTECTSVPACCRHTAGHTRMTSYRCLAGGLRHQHTTEGTSQVEQSCALDPFPRS